MTRTSVRPDTGVPRSRRAGAIAYLVCALLAGPAAAAEYMTQAELLATIPGATVRGLDDEGTTFAKSYAPWKGGRKSGQVKGVFGDPANKAGWTRYEARWYVEGNQWCEDWGTGKGCYDVERVDETSLRLYAAGRPRKHLWKIERPRGPAP